MIYDLFPSVTSHKFILLYSNGFKYLHLFTNMQNSLHSKYSWHIQYVKLLVAFHRKVYCQVPDKLDPQSIGQSSILTSIIILRYASCCTFCIDNSKCLFFLVCIFLMCNITFYVFCIFCLWWSQIRIKWNKCLQTVHLEHSRHGTKSNKYYFVFSFTWETFCMVCRKEAVTDLLGNL